MEQLAANLIRLRHAVPLSQSELSRRAGVSRVYIADLEAGRKQHISLDLAVRLAAQLQCRVDDLTTPLDTMTPITPES